MKLALACCQLFCFASLLFHVRGKYRLTLVYLAAAIVSTLAFRSDAGWLARWYLTIVAPVTLFRLMAAVEVTHRQTDGFRYWSRLMGGVFLLAGFFAGMFAILTWQHSGSPFDSMVQLRRLVQVFTGSIFLVLELFWVSMGGGWYRRSDWLAVWFGLLTMNHATVSVLAGAGAFPISDSWTCAQFWCSALDGVCYLGIAVSARFRVPGIFGKLRIPA